MQAVARRTGVFARWWLAAVPLAFLAVVLVAPALRLLAEGWGAESLWAPWQDDYLRGRLLWSLAQAAMTCVATLLLGLPMAWVLARWEFPGRALLLRGLMLPFVVPTLVAAMGVLAFAGPNGWLSRWGGPDLQGTPWLLLYGNLFFNLCVVVRAGVDALSSVSAARVAAARSLGATPWRAFWRVEWPAVAPWLASALCLVFLYCFSGFGLALVLGGQNYATAEVEIYTLVAHELQLGQAGVLSLWMLALTAIVAWGYAFMERRLATPARADAILRRCPQGWVAWGAVVAVVLIWMLICAAPLVSIARGAMNSGAMAWAVLTDEDTLSALSNTAQFSALALALATGLGLAHALAAQRVLWLRTLVFLPFIVSPVMVAFGLLLLYPQWSSSFGVLVAAYALLAYPFVAKSLAARLDSLPAHYLEAARSLGASPWRCFWRVTLPLLAPALRRGMAFAAATAVGEFAVSLFLSRPEWATLTTLIYQHLGKPGADNLAAAQVLACVLMGLALLAFVLIEWPTGEDEARA
ncbi:ABC transporter permease [Rhodoferax mekongensis]|uniref:Iron ABC transporter permease n=1 Tax=Rhodoferax mekongensis TaxID=3068341 RepID=A0ABZ0AXT5_9BURK|nr:iron ABC transporter permease [Rhodoferax sp. TBRC 17307]WNO04300.1 iron ABC transporter permease [Rhodoferax sp. TBRC 17307]